MRFLVSIERRCVLFYRGIVSTEKEDFRTCGRVVDPVQVEEFIKRGRLCGTGRDGTSWRGSDSNYEGDSRTTRFWLGLEVVSGVAGVVVNVRVGGEVIILGGVFRIL